MKGKLDLVDENNWVVRYTTEDPKSGAIAHALPISKYHKIIYKSKLYVDCDVEFKIATENDFIPHCKCTKEQFDNCEFFVRSGINECLNHESIEVKVAKLINIEPKPNETFDRDMVKQMLIEVKNRFAVMSNDNYSSDLAVIEWFERNYPKK